MPFREAKRNTDLEKTSEVGKQSKVENKCTTFNLLKHLCIVGLLATGKVSGAVVESSPDLTRSVPGRDNPSPNVTAHDLDYFQKLGVRDPEQFIRNVQQGKYDGETSSEPEESSKKKGRDPLSSKREKMETLRSVIDKLNEKKVRERLLLERDSEIPAARTLLPDKTSTCHDPCSETPASVDCIKQCTTPVSSNPSACLDVSISDVLAKVEPVSGLPAPNQQVRLNYTLSVQNHCPQTIKDVTYHIQGTGGCPNPSAFIPAPDSGVYIQSFSADPSSVAPGDSAGVKAGQDTSIISRCETYGAGFRITSSSLPPELSVSISASGTDSTTNLMVSSQEKTFIVLGDRPWITSACNQMCPPATDTPSTPATGTTSIVFVHGFQLSSLKKGGNSGQDCKKYWGDAMDFLRERGLSDLRTVKFYTGDINCQNGDETRYSSDLHHNLYKSSCTDYPAGWSEGSEGSEGTNDESLYHLSCLFSQYLNYNFGRPTNRDVVLVGHSMGGLIMRETLYQMQENAGQGPFPLTIGHVTKAITFNTPHSGTTVTTTKISNYIACGGCIQGTELAAGNALLSELATSGRNPQTSAGFTEWTVIGSECDLVVLPTSSAIDMDASHTIVYPKEGLLTCYGHGNALHDANLKRDANQFYCDTDNPVNSPCGTDYRKTGNTRWSKTGSGRRGLSQLYYSITGGAERVGSSRHLWLLSTAATA